MAKTTTEKAQGWIKTLWGPLVGVVMVIGSFYSLRITDVQLAGADEARQKDLEQHKVLSQQRYDTVVADLKRTDLAWRTEVTRATQALKNEIHRVDTIGCAPSIEVRREMAADKEQLKHLQADVSDIKADVKEIKSMLMSSPSGP